MLSKKDSLGNIDADLFGNTSIKNCHFIRCGNENGGLIWSVSGVLSAFRNIIFSNNIIEDASPNLSTPSSDFVYLMADIDLDYTANVTNPAYIYVNVIIKDNAYNSN